jgi:hypothetical protein
MIKSFASSAALNRSLENFQTQDAEMIPDEIV